MTTAHLLTSSQIVVVTITTVRVLKEHFSKLLLQKASLKHHIMSLNHIFV